MDIKPDAYEKLGSFYLGRTYDLPSGEMQDELVLYDSKDLTTHAVCVGMTGSGKTGLCVSLLEEAAIDGIPAIVIDPKGDIPNLLLTFPDLDAASFRPWINEDDARRKGQSPEEYAAGQADLWKSGLAGWGEDGARIQRLRDAVDMAVYTPGSEAGLPVSILGSFAVPADAILRDGDLRQERISTTVTGLLSLLDVEADPLRSREHILLSSLFDHAWNEGKALDLADLIRGVQEPPFHRVGVMDVDSFYPPKDRFELAMQFNNLLASPGFSSWMQGTPLDIDRIMYTEVGKPRVAIFSIAHLSDKERLFFTSLLLNEVLGWMRTRPGTNSLRALLYIDELFGFMPPVANPPTKLPLLTMLKQARAFGLGLVLATQNPVDLDYKGLSNTGTWFIGRLQTERDKMRVLEGLEGAAAGGGFDKGAMEEVLAGLGKRVFLMHNVHEPEPVIFHTRWAMSYLRGPMTRTQIKSLMDPLRSAASRAGRDGAVEATGGDGAAQRAEAPTSSRRRPASGGGSGATRPMLPPEVAQVFLPARTGDNVVYQPHLYGSATVHYVDTRRGIEHEEQLTLLTPISDGTVPVDWSEAEQIQADTSHLDREPVAEAGFGEVPRPATQPKKYAAWQKDLADELYRSKRYDLFTYAPLKIVSDPGESERSFRIRLGDALRTERDRKVEDLRDRYQRKIETAAERIRKAEQKVERENEQVQSQTMQNYVNMGTTLLSALLGSKRISRSSVGRASTTIRGMTRSSKEKSDVARALADLEARQEALAEIEEALQLEVDELKDALDPTRINLDTLTLKPRRTDVDIHMVALAWAPFVGTSGAGEPAWT